jgi:hypothetical protein
MNPGDVDEERRALQVAVQNVVREFENDGMVSGCVITYEVKRPDGGTHLAHRTFNHEGEPLPSWQAEGYLHDHLRVQDLRAKAGLTAPEEDPADDD